MTDRQPLSRQRSPWVEQVTMVSEIEGVPVRWFRRQIGDGLLYACIAEEPHGWHMSISFRNHRGELSRYPRWDEIADARDKFLPDNVDFVMWLPKSGEYVALHDTTFHLHEHPERR
jgi:hypothetical protein